MVTAKQEANEDMISVRKCFGMNMYRLSVIITVLFRGPVVTVIILCHLMCHGTKLKASQINS